MTAAGGDATFCRSRDDDRHQPQFRNRAGDTDVAAPRAVRDERTRQTRDRGLARASGEPMIIDSGPTSPSRRLFLRGVGVALALPWMESLPVFAQAARRPAANTPPLRLGIVFFSNGVEPIHWWAKGSGAAMELGPGLVPMMPHREDMVFVQGLFNQAGARLDQPAPRPHEPAVGRAGQPRSRTRSASARRWTRSSPRRSAAAPRSRASCSASSRTNCGSKTACR